MVAIRIMGGLGNQMLQYAAGRALSLLHETELKLDTFLLDRGVFPKGMTAWPYQLDLFPALRDHPKLNFGLPGALPLPNYPTLHLHHYLTGRGLFLKGLRRYDYYRLEEIDTFWDTPDNVYLYGYFFSTQYFAPYRDIILKELAFPPMTDKANLQLAESVQKMESVSVHVRRGDYLTVANSSLSTICDIPYYERAVAYMKRNVAAPHFVLFSDDIEWVKENLDFGGAPVTYVDHNHGEAAYEDMRLMSLCRHNIVANSTFSWWGAVLGEENGRIVVSPKKWYAETNDPSEATIRPGGWVQV